MGNIIYSTADTRPKEDGTLRPKIAEPDDPFVKQQTKVVEGTGDWGSGIHRSTLCKGELMGIVNPDVETLWDSFMRGWKLSKDRPCAGRREMKDGVAGNYTFFTFDEMRTWALELGSAMRHSGLVRGDNVGIFSKNNVEWKAVEQSCNGFSHPSVAIYDTFSDSAVYFIINHSELRLIYVEKTKIEALLAVVQEGTPNLKHVVSFGDVTREETDKFKAYGITLSSMSQFRKLGESNMLEPDTPSKDDISIIMYTSGTTGNPKGVVITHFNMVATANGCQSALALEPSDVYFSFLPLAHCFERCVETVVLEYGASIGYYQGDIRKLADDVRTLRPTLFVGVPRVFNRFYEKVMEAVEEGGIIKKTLFNRAFAARRAAMAKGHDTPFYNHLVFDKLRAVLGGRQRIMVSGSAPLDTRVHEFLQVCLCPIVQQGYGLTETCAGTVLQASNDMATGTCGHPLPTNEFKLVSVPDMEYFTTQNPPRGEIYIRGNGIFQCYFKEPAKTAEDKDADGWFHTGDIGQWTKHGSLAIIDRKKNIFKLSQGEYIAAESLEMVYAHAPHAAQVFIYGSSLKSFIVGLVVPHEDSLMAWAKERGIRGDFSAVCKNKATRTLLEGELVAQAKSAKLKGFEVVKGVLIHDCLFSVENGLMTPTFKIKRPAALKIFRDGFDQLYEEIEAEMKKPKAKHSGGSQQVAPAANPGLKAPVAGGV